jgi:hypothetical protein
MEPSYEERKHMYSQMNAHENAHHYANIFAYNHSKGLVSPKYIIYYTMYYKAEYARLYELYYKKYVEEFDNPVKKTNRHKVLWTMNPIIKK